MDAVLTRTADAPVPTAPETKLGAIARALGNYLSAMVSATAEELVFSQRDLPPTFYRFPFP